MTLLRDQDDKWAVLEMLVNHTVHQVLFQDSEEPLSPLDALDAHQEQLVHAEAVVEAEALPFLVLKRAKQLEEDPDLQYVDHCKRVMGCQHWTSEELQQEKDGLKKYLQQQQMVQQQAAGGNNQQVSSELYSAFEAYALLKLFLLERTTVDAESLASSLKLTKDRDHFLLLLHVQLELFSMYFERSQQRKVQTEPQFTRLTMLSC